MPKFLNVLAASVGGGIALGLGIRAGERLLSQSNPESPRDPSDNLSLRLASLEKRLTALDTREKRLTALDTRPGNGTDPVFEGPGDAGDQPSVAELREEFQTWLNAALNTRLASMEERLRAESHGKQQAALEALVDSLQTRVVHRIAKLETEVSAQGTALSELKDYSMQTERNMHKLLEGIERLIANQKRSVLEREEVESYEPDSFNRAQRA